MSIKCWLPLIALLCLPSPALAAHSGSAPTDPSPSDDEHFVVDTDQPGLDTGCTFREQGPLVFKVKIDRYVGNANNNGNLTNAQLLKDKGVIAKNARLVLPAFDIDIADGEVDDVYFNGQKIGTLKGSNGTWYENEFTVPIELVKFPAMRGENGEKPTAAENEIRIDIDTRGEGWCTAIDWGEISFKAMHPLLLIHGTGDNPRDCWEGPGVTQHLMSLGIPFEHRIQLEPNGRILPLLNEEGNVREPGNAQALEGYARTIAQSFGVQKVHLVAHSKGGLDSRGYLRRFYNPEQVRVLSLHTLSSPHWGTVLSDISVRARNARRTGEPPVAQQGDRDMAVFLYYDSLAAFSGGGPQSPALDVQQTAAMRGFNQEIGVPPSDVKFYTYGADADLNGDGDIDNAEVDPLLPRIPLIGNAPGYNRAEAGTASYHLLRDVSTVSIRRVARERRSLIPFLPPKLVIETDITRSPTSSRQLNDIIVTNNSSRLGLDENREEHLGPENNWLRRNHATIKFPDIIDRVLERIRRDEPVN